MRLALEHASTPDPARAARHAPRRALLALALVAVTGTTAAHAEDDRFHVDVGVAREFERFQSREADSLGLSFGQSMVGIVAFDFRVMDVPMKKPSRPELRVFGSASSLQRVFVDSPLAGGPGVTSESPMFEVSGGIGFAVPMGMVDGSEGAVFRLEYEGGVFVSRDTGENFLQRSMLNLGFERRGGVFDGSGVLVSNGHHDLFGAAFAAGRWSASTRLVAGLGRPHVEAGAKPAPTAGRRPLRAFVELAVETDGKPGPDRVALRTGLMLDAGSVLGRVGSVGF